MRRLNKWQSAVFLLGACLMVAGVGMYVFGVSGVACWVFAAGAVAFSGMQALQAYEGRDLTIRRLRRLMLVGDMLFVISALLMIENSERWLFPYFMAKGIEGYNAYLQYIHNNWVLTLIVAAFIQLYTTHRISKEIGKA